LGSVDSEPVARALANDSRLMRVIFAGEWDSRRGAFVPPEPGLVTPLVKAGKSLLGISNVPWSAPGPERLREYLAGNVEINKDPKLPIAILTFEHKDRQFAKRLLSSVHGAIDRELRMRALARTQQSIAYLSDQLQRVTLADHRTALSQALSEQERIRMMANSNLPFAAEPFGPPTVSSAPSSPRPGIVLTVSLILGAMIGAGAALALNRRAASIEE
jgi:hypothetical protein